MRCILVASWIAVVCTGTARAADPWVEWVDLVEAFPRAVVAHSPSTQLERVTAGGESRESIFQHPAGVGDRPATIRFLPFFLPVQAELDIRFHAAIGFRDGEGFAKANSDGCEFIVSVNAREVFRQTHAAQQWNEIAVDLSEFAGKQITLQLSVLPRKHNAADWAAWAEPMVEVRGPADVLASAQRGDTLIAPIASMDELRRSADTRYAARASGGSWIGVLDKTLDLDFATRIHSTSVSSPVPLPPKIVVGEGPHEDNHTLIRVFSEYGVVESQFLAFPPDVKGGVHVELLRDGLNRQVIAATPIAAALGVVRVFSLQGEVLAQWRPYESSTLTICGGNFSQDHSGDELVVARTMLSDPRQVNSTQFDKILLTDALGRNSLAKFEIIRAPQERLHLTSRVPGNGETAVTDPEQVVLYHPDRNELREFDGGGVYRRRVELVLVPRRSSITGSAFQADRLWAMQPSDPRSAIRVVDQQGSFQPRYVEREERRTWIALPEDFQREFGPLKGASDAKHVRIAKYEHLRVDALSPRYRDPASKADVDNAIETLLQKRQILRPFSAGKPRMWNPCFTHRSFPDAFMRWATATDDQSLSLHMMQSQYGAMDGFDGKQASAGLISATYAPHNRKLQSLYTQPLRAMLRRWAPLYRAEPDVVASLEPNHEHEIAIGSHGSVGDYNPHMITGFYEWLVNRYGVESARWEESLGIRVRDHFDAPRGMGRGQWDRYSTDNPFFVAWVQYNRHVINRVLATTFREALLAGVPPEMIHSHQIPDRFAVGPALSPVTRISPIDYAMTAGVNFGFTRFGVSHQRSNNIVRAAATSGFSQFVMGEFQPLTSDAELAERELRHVVEHGGKAVHILHWGAKHRGEQDGSDDPLANALDRRKNEVVHRAVEKLLRDDPPREAFAEPNGRGNDQKEPPPPILRIRRCYISPLQGPDAEPAKNRKPAHVVSLNLRNSTVLKSVREDGSMEGSIYLTPFRQHIDVATVPIKRGKGTLTLPPQDMTPGSQWDVGFMLRAKRPTDVTVTVMRHGQPLPKFDAKFTVEGDQHLRYQLRSPERASQIGLVFRIGNASVVYFHPTLQSPQFADVHVGEHTGTPHRGGVTFDVAND